jgi:hypothetical protein
MKNKPLNTWILLTYLAANHHLSNIPFIFYTRNESTLQSYYCRLVGKGNLHKVAYSIQEWPNFHPTQRTEKNTSFLELSNYSNTQRSTIDRLTRIEFGVVRRGGTRAGVMQTPDGYLPLARSRAFTSGATS